MRNNIISINSKNKDLSKSPFISILIPSYNRSKYIKNTVLSASSQDYTSFEIIVVDDGSSDNTADIISSLDDPRLRFVTKEHSGAPATRNRCIKEAGGEYLLWLDSDDELMPGILTQYAKVLEQNPETDIVYGDLEIFDDQGGSRIHRYDDHHKDQHLLSKMLRFNAIPNPGTLVSKSLYKRFGGYDESFRRAHDYEFWCRVTKLANTKHSGVISCRWRWHDSNMSSGTVQIDTSFEAGVIKRLCNRFGIHELFPELDWTDIGKSSAAAWTTIGNFLQTYKDFDNAIIAYEQALRTARDNSSLVAIIADTVSQVGTVSGDYVSELEIKGKTLESNPLVSVIVPTMNRPDLLERALRSLVNQAYENWEAVVVNDGGEDVQDLVMSIDSSKRIQYYNLSENQGASSARNTAIQASNGSVLCYLDDDDVFLPDHLAIIVDVLQNKNAEFVYCEAVYEVEKGQDNNQEVTRTTPYSGISYSKDQLDVSNFIPINTWGHRRELLEKSGLFDISLLALEDWEMLLRFSRLTDFIHIPKLTVEVHRPASLGKNHLLSRERDQLPQLYCKLYDRYPVDSREVQNKRIALLASWGVDYKPAYIGRIGTSTPSSLLEKILVCHDFLGGSLAEVARTMVENNPKEFVKKEKQHNLYFNVAKEILYRCQEKNNDSQQSSDSVLREASLLLSEVLGEAPGMKKAQMLREEIAAHQQTKDYQLWMLNHQLREIDGQLFAERMVMKWNQKPVFHCIMFLFPGEENLLADTLDSFGSQLYQEWRLTVIAETPAPDPLWEELDVLEWVEFNEGANPYELLNSFVFEVTADWAAFIQPGVKLPPHALIQIADYINIRPNWKLIYTDEDVIDNREGHKTPKFKPDFNLDMLRSQPYIGNACFVKWDVLKTIGGYEAYISAENHDISFKVFEQYGEKGIGHIADILFHFPAESKRVLDETTIQKVVQYHLQRSEISAVVQSGYLPGTTRIVYEHNEFPLVSIVIPNQNRFEYIEPCLKSLIEKTDYPNYEIIIVDFGSTDKETLELYANMQHLLPDSFSVVHYDGEFNYSAMCNKGMANAKAEFVLFLNYDTKVLHAEWLSRMMAHAQRPDVGIVGARLTFPETSKLQHAGQILGLLGGAEQSICDDLMLKEPGYMDRAQIVQNFSAVTDRCMLVKRKAYQAVAGMDEQDFAISYNNIDLCLKVCDYGLRVVWTPYATLVSYGFARNKSDGGDLLTQAKIMERSKKDHSNLLKKWLPILANDPAYNPNLSLAHHDFRIEMQIPRNWDVNFHDRERILGFPSRGGSGDYRVIQPFDALSAAGMQQSEYYRVGPSNIKTSVDLLEIARLKPDTLVVQAATNDLQMHLVEQVSEYLPDIYRIFTIDDLITDVPTKSSAYRNNQRYFKDVRKRLRKVLSKCNRLIVTTQPLADAFSDMIDDVRVVPNRLVRDKWVNLKSQRQTSDKPRVGWVGAQQHQGDLEIIYEVVKQTADKVDWVFMGMCPDEIKAHVREYHEFVPIDQYPEKMASLNLDLAVAPLEIHPFNEAKSNLRLLEYGVMGWPVVCTDITPYQSFDAPVTRVPNITENWVNAIMDHVNDLQMAHQKGDRLRQWVINGFILEDHLDEIAEIFTINKNIEFYSRGKLVRFYLPDQKDHIQRQILKNQKFYEWQMLVDIEECLSPCAVVVDVGANIGNHTTCLGLLDTVKKVYSFEPNSVARAVLQKNLELNRLEDKVEVSSLALGVDVGWGKLILPEQHNSGMAQVSLGLGGDISVDSLDHSILHKIDRCDVIKIDVEGMEMDVLMGAENLIRRFHPLLYIECATPDSLEVISKYLLGFGYHPKQQFNATPTYRFDIEESTSGRVIHRKEEAKRTSRIAFFAGDEDNFHFAREIINHFRDYGYEVRVVKSAGLSPEVMHEHMRWCDVAWFEWGVGPIVVASRLPKVCKIICRIHRYEIYTNQPSETNWNNVDHLVFVSKVFLNVFKEYHSKEIEHITDVQIIPNTLDLSLFPFIERKRGFNIAYISRFHAVKNIPLMLQVMVELVGRDPRYMCYFVGRIQDITMHQYFNHMVRQLGLEKNVFYQGVIEDVGAWLEDKHFVLSTSTIESQGVGIMEAMAMGLKPVIHSYFGGAEGIFGDKYVFNRVSEAIEMFLSEDYNPLEYRDVIASRYQLSDSLAAMEAMVLDQDSDSHRTVG